MFELAKRIIAAINTKDKEKLKIELDSLTGAELMVFLNSGYKFLIPDIFRVMEKADAEPDAVDLPEYPGQPIVLRPVADSKRDESIRTLFLPAGSIPVGVE